MGNSTGPEPASDAIRDAATRLTHQIADYFHREKTTINEIIFVPLILSARIFRTYDAIALLLQNGFLSEAAVLVLTQFELRLDLAYTAHDISHATQWAEHENMDWSVAQKMEKKINSLFSERDDRKRLSDIFKYLSGIKHGNPIYSGLGFPARGNIDGLLISTGGIDDSFSVEFSRQLARYAKYQLAWSSQALSVYTGQYAIVDLGLRKAIRGFYLTLQATEEEFQKYLANIVTQDQGPFGLKGWRRKPHSR
jgi:hypothetical protein